MFIYDNHATTETYRDVYTYAGGIEAIENIARSELRTANTCSYNNYGMCTFSG